MEENKALQEEKQKVIVTIFNDDYTIKTENSEEYTKTIANKVDMKMHEIASANPALPQYKIAVLAALYISEELYDSKIRYEELLNIAEKL